MPNFVQYPQFFGSLGNLAGGFTKGQKEVNNLRNLAAVPGVQKDIYAQYASGAPDASKVASLLAKIGDYKTGTTLLASQAKNTRDAKKNELVRAENSFRMNEQLLQNAKEELNNLINAGASTFEINAKREQIKNLLARGKAQFNVMHGLTAGTPLEPLYQQYGDQNAVDTQAITPETSTPSDVSAPSDQAPEAQSFSTPTLTKSTDLEKANNEVDNAVSKGLITQDVANRSKADLKVSADELKRKEASEGGKVKAKAEALSKKSTEIAKGQSAKYVDAINQVITTINNMVKIHKKLLDPNISREEANSEIAAVGVALARGLQPTGILTEKDITIASGLTKLKNNISDVTQGLYDPSMSKEKAITNTKVAYNRLKGQIGPIMGRLKAVVNAYNQQSFAKLAPLDISELGLAKIEPMTNAVKTGTNDNLISIMVDGKLERVKPKPSKNANWVIKRAGGKLYWVDNDDQNNYEEAQ